MKLTNAIVPIRHCSLLLKGGKPADTLQLLRVDVFDDEKCGAVYKSRGGVITPGDQVCAGGERGKDSCVGDSGSALMRDTDAGTGFLLFPLHTLYIYLILGLHWRKFDNAFPLNLI